MTVWNDRKIIDWAQAGGVTPFDAACVNPASLDLRLGNLIREPHQVWLDMTREEMKESIALGEIDNLPKWGEAKRFDKFWLFPGEFVLCHSLELVRIPVYVASILVLKSSKGRLGLNHSHCLSGDTLIDVPRDLSAHPDGIPIRDLVGTEFLTYSFDISQMKFVLAPATAFAARKNTKVVKVTYEWMTGRVWRTDNITCTPDHKFLTLDCRWVEAQNLTGERLMPLWRGKDDRYAWVRTNPVTQHVMREHRFVAEQVYDLDRAQQVHHVNENRLDNRPENLSPIERGIHQSLHSQGERNPFFGKIHSDETRKRLSAVRTGKKLSESHKNNMSRAFSGENNPRYVEISLGQMVDAYRKTGKIIDAAALLGIHEETFLSKVKANGFKGTVDFRKHIDGMQNHKVIRVEELSSSQDTFDICVPDYENFVANGVVVHNSGWGDPGFGLAAEPSRVSLNGDYNLSGASWTWELQNISPWPIKLTAGERLIQQVFFDMSDAPDIDYRYTGHYVYQSGPTPARDKS